MHFETASIDRKEIVHFVQLMNSGAEPFRKIEIVRRQLVLGVAASTDTAVATREAAAATRSNAARVWIVGVDAWTTEVDSHWSFVERSPLPISIATC